MNEEYLTVTEITKYLENKFKRDSNLRNIYISGEISNYVVYPKTGIAYFTLKDKKSKIPAVIYLRARKLIKFTSENGMNVLIKGSVEVYSKNGAYQLKVNNMKEDGLGELHIAFEQLKKKLEKEGYFYKSHKKEIPRFPKRIGVITAKSGAALRDIITTIKRRWPICEILLLPSYVQGENAKKDLVRQIKNAENYNLDTLIIGRGGGSIEDLWTFNEEIVAKAIYNCPIPTISAVGHETDSTISDYTADLRAPTPTAAGELAVPELNEMENKVSILFKKAFDSINHKIKYNSKKFSYMTKKECLNDPNVF